MQTIPESIEEHLKIKKSHPPVSGGVAMKKYPQIIFQRYWFSLNQ
jgi:hypothetical protein